MASSPSSALPAKRKQQDSETEEPTSKFSKESSSSDLGTLWSGSSVTVVIFGDSYSASSLDQADEDEDAELTWVDHLQGRPDLQDASFRNFSFPGATAEDDLEIQTTRFFVECPPKKTPGSNPALDPLNTYYVFFLGINDCGRTDDDELEGVVETVLDATHTLYVKAGARTFIFVDVPPIDRSPSATEFEETFRTRVEAWNEQLRAQVTEFVRETPQATVYIFSAHDTITDILDDPEEYDFVADDTTEEGGAIWSDGLHLTATVHKIIADKFLTTVTPEG